LFYTQNTYLWLVTYKTVNTYTRTTMKIAAAST